jgi:hypothetical protein
VITSRGRDDHWRSPRGDGKSSPRIVLGSLRTSDSRLRKEIDEITCRYYIGAHTGGDVFAYFPADRVLAAGDAFTFGAATPQLVDYQNGGSAKDWTATLDRALQLDFDTVVPGHGDVTTSMELRTFRDSTLAMRTRVHDMLMPKKAKDEISAVLKADFKGAQLVFPGLLDGLLTELQ